MNRVKNFLFNLDINIKNIIFLSVIVGVLVGFFWNLPFFSNSFFSDLANSYVLLTLVSFLIIYNSQGFKEAGVKVGIFIFLTHLIIFIISLLFGNVLLFYILKWVIISLISIPLAMLFCYIRLENIWGSLLLCILTVFVIYFGYQYFLSLKVFFPNHLISFIFTILTVILFLSCRTSKHLVWLSLGIVFFASIILCFLIINSFKATANYALGEGDWQCESSIKNYGAYGVIDGVLVVDAKKRTANKFTCLSSTGEKIELIANIKDNVFQLY